MLAPRWLVRLAGIAIGGLIGLLLAGGCHNCMNSQSPTRGRDINAVLSAHQDMLLAKTGVVGVCVGLMADGKTQCLKVLLVRKDPTLERSLPKMLEGYPVLTEITGEIQPMAR